MTKCLYLVFVLLDLLLQSFSLPIGLLELELGVTNASISSAIDTGGILRRLVELLRKFLDPIF